MTDRHRVEDASVREQSAVIAARLNAQLSDVTRSIQDALTEGIPDLRGDSQLLDLLGASVEGNVDTMFHALRYDIAVNQIEAPTAALEYARRLAQHRVPVDALVRAYRLGQQHLLKIAVAEIRRAELEPQLRFEVLDRITAVTLGYIDWISQQVVAVYERERVAWLENFNRVQAVRVREILSGKDIDGDSLDIAIGYPLGGNHLAVVAWWPEDRTEDDGLVQLERFIRQLAAELRTDGDPLVVAADRVTVWAWIPLGSANGADPVDLVRRFVAQRKAAPSLALGCPATGVQGFRRSHEQAQTARTVAISGGVKPSFTTTFNDPALAVAALCSDNLPAARVWVHEVLGGLSVCSDGDARLRHTLETYLQHGSSYTAAAVALHLHYNSVKYRVHRALERRGRPITDDRLDVEVALAICHWFGTSVLQPPSE
jgi:hypothetical protein